MTWPEFAAARLLLSEKRVGAALRAVTQAEDDEVANLKAAIRRQGR